MAGKSERDDLRALGPQPMYADTRLNQVVFPIGGIGTGFVGLTGRGGLAEVSIANRPSFSGRFPFTFPLIFAQAKGEAPVCRVLEGPVASPYTSGPHFTPHTCGEGLPHMDACTFRGEYPFAWIDFTSRKLPVSVSLEAYNPFIPSNPDDSGIPVAVFRYTLKNRTRKPVQTSVAWTLHNPVGSLGLADLTPGTCEHGYGGNVNTYREAKDVRGLYLTSEKWAVDHPRFGSVSLTTPDKPVTVMRYWLRDQVFARPQHEIWDTFSTSGRLPDHDYGPSPEGQTTPGGLGVRCALKPGETRTITFYLSWYFPHYEQYWMPASEGGSCCGGSGRPRHQQWRNYYAHQFADAFDVAEKTHRNEKRLRAESMRFHDALFSSTLPPYVIDAVASQMAILKTATCLRLEDGTFYAFEGSAPGSGCCDGSCTHVWNYQQALPFLFPSLERSMREADYTYNMHPDGKMGFRIQLPLGSPPWDYYPCADGQLGGIIKTYRDWRICGDDAWLRRLWPDVQHALEYAWVQWDADKDGVIDGVQHNTYDIEFVGANPLTACFYLGALEAGARMAEHLGEPDKASEYRAVAENGRRWVEQHLFNGAYYIQTYDPAEAPVHQFGAGCFSDALLGQWMGHIAGLDHVLDPKRIRKMLKAILKHNFRASFYEHACAMVLVCALNDDQGLVTCSWPRGGKPEVPFAYYDEVWAGIEYQVASHCIIEGLIDEGLKLVKAVRDRHDGYRRNPWDQFECCGGHHYARVMSSYGLLNALSGFTFDLSRQHIGFAPRIHEAHFSCFWALDGAWGTFEQQGRTARVNVLWGALPVRTVALSSFAMAQGVSAKVGDRNIRATLDADGVVALGRTVKLRAGQSLEIQAGTRRAKQ